MMLLLALLQQLELCNESLVSSWEGWTRGSWEPWRCRCRWWRTWRTSRSDRLWWTSWSSSRRPRWSQTAKTDWDEEKKEYSIVMLKSDPWERMSSLRIKSDGIKSESDLKLRTCWESCIMIAIVSGIRSVGDLKLFKVNWERFKYYSTDFCRQGLTPTLGRNLLPPSTRW